MPRATRESFAHSRRASPTADKYCETCNKEFSRPSELKRHLKNTLIHNPNARKFECRYCGALHTQKSNLKIHERIHFSQQKECCGLPLDETRLECSFKCSDPSSMIRHIDNIHLSPYIDNDLAIPDWLVQALRTRQTAKLASRRSETASPLSTSASSSPSPTENSALIPSTPLPSPPAETSSLPRAPKPQHAFMSKYRLPRWRQLPKCTSQTLDAAKISVASDPSATPGLPGQLGSTASLHMQTPIRERVDLELDLANFNLNNYDNNQSAPAPIPIPVSWDEQLAAPSALFSQTTSNGLDQFSPSQLHMDFPQFSGENEFSSFNCFQDLEDLITLTNPSFSETMPSASIPSNGMALFNTDMNNQFPFFNDTLSPLNFFSPMEQQTQIELHNFS